MQTAPERTASAARPVVWIVDDSATERAITARALGADTYRLVELRDGTEAVERLMEDAALPDLILLDWVMPGMSGDEVCRFVRANQRTRDLPLILVTASRVETQDVVQGLASGANDYVARPFAPQELRARVITALRTKYLADIAQREHARLETVNRFASALFQAQDTMSVLNLLASSLVRELCDGCSIMLLPGELPPAFLSVHRHESSGETLASISSLADPAVHTFESAAQARAVMPPAYHAYIDRFGLRSLAILPFPIRSPIAGVVTVTRDGGSPPLDPADIATLGTCIEYAGLAIQSAMRFEALQANARERERVAQFQEQMLGIVGHDLRSPLGAVLTGAEMLAEMATDPRVPSVARRIESSATRMARIVDQLLDVTRARLGSGIPVAPRDTALVPLVRSVTEELALAHPKARFEVRGDQALAGRWDPDRLGQVISNLAGNAVHYGRVESPITIDVGAPEGGRVVITVHNELRDEPVPAERLQSLFDPYQRGRTGSDNATGLGLGLYIVHEIITAHGGSIAAASDATGTTFRVELPVTSG